MPANASCLLDVGAAGVELVGDQALGQGHLDLLQERLEDGVAGGGRLLEALAAAEALAHVGGQLVDGVELRGHLRELVVELGELLLLDLGDGDLDLDVLADEVAAHELRGEVLVVAGGHAVQRLVEAVEHAAAADLVGHAADLGTLDDLAVLGGHEVEHHEVAVGGRALDVGQRAEALAQVLQLLLDVGVGDGDVLDARLETGEVGDRDLGLDVDLGGELQGLVVLEAGHLDLGLRERLEGVGLQRLHVLLGEHVVDRLVEDRAAADLAVDDHRGHLAAAEAGDVDLLGNLLVRRVEARLELLEGHLDGQLGPGRAQGLDGALHQLSPVSTCISRCIRRCIGSYVGATGLEPAISCSQSRRASHYATPRQKAGRPPGRTPCRAPGADDGNRTRVASLEDWGSTIPTSARRSPRPAQARRQAEIRVGHRATGQAPDPNRGRRRRTARPGAGSVPGQTRCTSSRARSSSRTPTCSTRRAAPPATSPRRRSSARPSSWSMPRPMSRRRRSTMPSV